MSLSSHFNLVTEKAGMESIDHSKVNRVVLDLSKNTPFFKKEQRKLTKLKQSFQQRIKNSVRPSFFDAQAIMAQIEAKRSFGKMVIHVDMDMFYAAVAVRDNPTLKGKPVAVGTMAMVATACYEARKFGVRSGMPGFIAKKLCPDLVFVKSDFKAYKKASEQVRRILKPYDSQFEPTGLDEAYVDITKYCKEKNMDLETSGASIASEIRRRIKDSTGLTASAGVACNHLLAKIASDKNKPDGQFIIPPDRDEICAFLAPLSIRKIPGVGKVTERILNEIGVTSCEEMAEKASEIFLHFKEKSARAMLAAVVGVELGEKKKTLASNKSLSTERFFRPLKDLREIEEKCREVTGILINRFGETGMTARTVSVSLKKVDFDVIVRSKTLETPVSTFEEVLPEVLRLVRKELPLTLRSLGVKLSGLKAAGENRIQRYYDKSKGDVSGGFGVVAESLSAKRREKTPRPEKKKRKNSAEMGNSAVQKAIGCYFGLKNVAQLGQAGFERKEAIGAFDCPKCGGRFWGLLGINLHIDECFK